MMWSDLYFEKMTLCNMRVQEQIRETEKEAMTVGPVMNRNIRAAKLRNQEIIKKLNKELLNRVMIHIRGILEGKGKRNYS